MSVHKSAPSESKRILEEGSRQAARSDITRRAGQLEDSNAPSKSLRPTERVTPEQRVAKRLAMRMLVAGIPKAKIPGGEKLSLMGHPEQGEITRKEVKNLRNLGTVKSMQLAVDKLGEAGFKKRVSEFRNNTVWRSALAEGRRLHVNEHQMEAGLVEATALMINLETLREGDGKFSLMSRTDQLLAEADLSAIKVNDLTDMEPKGGWKRLWSVDNGFFSVVVGENEGGEFNAWMNVVKIPSLEWVTISTGGKKLVLKGDTLQQVVARVNGVIGDFLGDPQLGPRIRGDVGHIYKGLIDGRFSMLNPKRGKISAAQLEAVEDELKRVLGDKVALRVLDNMSFAGKFADIDGVETIMLASWAANVMDNGYHESVHAFMARLMKSNQKARNVLLRAANAPHIVARLNELLAKHPDALKQLTTKGQMELNPRRKVPLTEEQAEMEAAEERVAYMYQFWRLGKTGLLKVGPETETWLSKVKWFFRRIAAIWADDMVTAESVIKAGDILNAFRRGRFSDPNTVAEVMHERFPGDPRERMEKVFPSLARFMEKFVWTSTGAVRDMNLSALTHIMDQFYTPIDAKNMEPGFRQSRHVEFNKRMNQIFAILKPLSEAQRRNVLDDMRSGKARTLPASKKLEPILNELFEYMKTSGVMVRGVNAAGEEVYHPLRKIMENYFPRVPDVDYLMTAKGKEKFIALLEKYKYTDAEAIHANYVQGVNAGNPRESDAAIGLTFFTPQTNERTLTRIPEGELAPFLNKDLVSTLTQYVSRATRRAEYTRRFGNAGEKIQKARELAETQGMTAVQGKTFDEAVKALEGTLGANMSDELKAVYGALMTYQNIRLLPLALFSSLVDPLGILVRGGTFSEATSALWRGLSDLVSVEKDSAFNLAASIGAINAAMDQEMMHDMYNSQYMPKSQQMINDMYFRFNGMESWNRSMRVAASAAAEQFIIRHAKHPNKHSARYMEELNLTPDDVKLDHGKLVLNDKTRKALNTWVDQAILRPDAALRPIYMSDPNWMLVSHLKQYMYLYQKTIIARVVRELEHGNYSPMWALTMYVPMIIASDMARVILTPGQGDDDSRKAWGAGDWLSRGVQRAGIFGPGQMVIDGWTDASYGKLGVESAFGPTAQQLLDFVRASAGHGDIGKEVLRAIPGERLVRGGF